MVLGALRHVSLKKAHELTNQWHSVLLKGVILLKNVKNKSMKQ